MKGTTLWLLILTQMVWAQTPVSLIQMPVRQERISIPQVQSAVRIPLYINSGLPFVAAGAGELAGRYILDTGAPLLILNQPAHASSTTQEASGVAGAFATTLFEVPEFYWRAAKRKSVPALTADLSHIETMVKHSVTGIIGYDLLKDSELLLDYKNQQAMVLDSKKSEWYKTAALHILPFTLQAHLPVIEVQIGQHILRLALDTGAGINLIDQRYADLLPATALVWLGEENLQGVDQNINRGATALLTDLNIGDAPAPDMKVLFTDLSLFRSKTAPPIDGLLGYPFFSQVKCSIHYPEQKLYIWVWH